jgi:hypothetical protein
MNKKQRRKTSGVLNHASRHDSGLDMESIGRKLKRRIGRLLKAKGLI